MWMTFDRAMSATLSLCAIVVAGAVVRREIRPQEGSAVSEAPVPMPEWKEALPIGVRIGNESAPVTIAVFSDFQCPGCRAMHEIMREVLKDHESEVSLLYVHYPLGSHKFAIPAAQAAECARELGQFPQFADAVFAQQDSIGVKSWGSFAQTAGIADTTRIARCAADPVANPRVKAGRALAMRFELDGTPTVVINGQRYSKPPGRAEIERAINAALSKRS